MNQQDNTNVVEPPAGNTTQHNLPRMFGFGPIPMVVGGWLLRYK